MAVVSLGRLRACLLFPWKLRRAHVLFLFTTEIKHIEKRQLSFPVLNANPA